MRATQIRPWILVLCECHKIPVCLYFTTGSLLKFNPDTTLPEWGCQGGGSRGRGWKVCCSNPLGPSLASAPSGEGVSLLCRRHCPRDCCWLAAISGPGGCNHKHVFSWVQVSLFSLLMNNNISFTDPTPGKFKLSPKKKKRQSVFVEGLNLRPSDPEADALSIEIPRQDATVHCLYFFFHCHFLKGISAPKFYLVFISLGFIIFCCCCFFYIHLFFVHDSLCSILEIYWQFYFLKIVSMYPGFCNKITYNLAHLTLCPTVMAKIMWMLAV
jgi:hypothetical protein